MRLCSHEYRQLRDDVPRKESSNLDKVANSLDERALMLKYLSAAD